MGILEGFWEYPLLEGWKGFPRTWHQECGVTLTVQVALRDLYLASFFWVATSILLSLSLVNSLLSRSRLLQNSSHWVDRQSQRTQACLPLVAWPSISDFSRETDWPSLGHISTPSLINYDLWGSDQEWVKWAWLGGGDIR